MSFSSCSTDVKTSENFVRLHLGHVLLILIFLVGISFPTWDYGDAENQVCFNATGTGQIYGKLWSTPWTVFDVALPKNSTFFNEGLTGSFSFFVYAQNATHVFVALPAINNLTSQRYCIYSGGADTEGLNSNIASVFYENSQGSWANGSNQNVSYGETLNVSNNSFTTTGYAQQLISWSITNYYVKSKQNISAVGPGIATSNKVCLGPSSITSNCNGGLTFFNNYTWQFDGKNIYQDGGVGSWRISETRSNTSAFNATVFDENMSSLGTNSGTVALARYYAEAYAMSSTVRMDWMFVGRIGPVSYTPNVSDISFDFQDQNITFTSPAWGADFAAEDTAVISVYFGKAYDECNLTFENGTVIDTFTPLTGQTLSTSIDMATMPAGDSDLIMNCSVGGVLSHRYHMITQTGSTPTEVFLTAFGASPSDLGCPANATLELAHCIEGYNISKQVDFAAVVCLNLGMTGYNYSCLQADNITKNNYTIFFRPAGDFAYPGQAGTDRWNTTHVGADFIYYGTTLDTGMEILRLPNNTGTPDGYFIYIPAQYKPRDCDIYWMNLSGCSWGKGMTLNNASVLVSDRSNNWFSAGSSGIEPYDINYSQQTPAVTVFTIIASSGEMFPDGIYTRLNCFVDNTNQTFNIRIKNTLMKNYTYYATFTSNPPVNITTQSYQYYASVNLTGLTQVIMYDTNEGTELCRYANGSTLFLPFVMPADLMPTSFEIITWAMMIFMTVLTSIVPFAVILMVLWNDVYHMLNISQIAIVCMLSILFGFVNSSFNMERGIKHMLIILCIAAAYLAAIAPYADDEGIDLDGFDAVVLSFNSLMDANDIPSFAAGVPGFVTNLFLLILTLPITFVSFVMSMLKMISLPLWTAAQSVAPYVTVGFVLYFYLKAYEVLSNRFRPV